MPLPAVYCIGNFALMLLSLLETILVMHLIEKDISPPEKASEEQTRSEDGNKQGKADFHNCHRGETRNQFNLEFTVVTS